MSHDPDSQCRHRGTARDAIPALPDATGVLIAVALLVAGFGTAEEHARAIAPIRTACPPLFEFVTPIPYAGLQQYARRQRAVGHPWLRESALPRRAHR